MSTLGKVLLGVNVLLAIGVFYLASQDYAKRNALNQYALKYQIALDGVAVEPIKGEGEPDADTVIVAVAGPNGIATAKPVSKKLVEGLFSGTDQNFGLAGVPTSQVEEVKEVEKKYFQKVDGLAGDDARIADLCGYQERLPNGAYTFRPGLLLALADSYEERQAIRALVPPPGQRPDAAILAANAKKARDRLKARFDNAVAPPSADAPETERKTVEDLKTRIAANPMDKDLKIQLAALSAAGPAGPPSSDRHRRMRIAQLLMGMNPSPNWQKRVALTVGLKIYQLAISEQAGRIELMLTQTKDARFSDQQAHDAEYEQLKSFALENSKLVDQQDRVVKGLITTLAADQSIFDTRTAQLNALKTELSLLTVEVNKKLAAQQAVEKALFAVQREVGQTLRETGRMEEDLRSKDGK
jgi:hypothetical protein